MRKRVCEDFAFIPEAEARVLPYGWGTLSFLAEAAEGVSAHVSLARVTIKSGTRNMRHRHPNCDELLHLLHGTLRHSAGDVWVDMRPGDTIRISRGVAHQAEVTSTDDAVMLVVYSAGDRQTEEVAE